MGTSCMSSKKAPAHHHQDFTTPPEDTVYYSQLSRQNLPKIKFTAMLYNTKIINYQKASVSIKFTIDDIAQVHLPRKNKIADSNQIKWKLKEVFEFIVDQYELRMKFLTIEVFDEINKKVNELRVNLFRIATGPFHQDFDILGVRPDVRLQFDLKISQYVEIKVECEQTMIQLAKKQYPGEGFYFTFLVLREEKQEPFQSSPSYSQINPYAQTKNQIVCGQYDQCPSPIKIKAGKSALKVHKNTAILNWNVKSGDMPSFKVFLKSHQIKKTALHFVIWRISGSTNANIFCGAYIPITRLFENDPIIQNQISKDLKCEHRELFLQNESLWCGDEKFGHFSMKLKIDNNTFIKQMKACTRTQNGIIESIPFFSSYSLNRKEEQILKYKAIQQIIENIEKINREINQNSKSSCLHSQKLKDSMIDQFQKVKKFFEAQEQNSYVIPSNQQQSLKMMEDQSLLMSLVLKITIYTEDDEDLTDVCWKIVLAIMKRGQFNLNNVGFSRTQIEEMKNNVSNFLSKKIKIALQFQEVMYKLLLLSLKIGFIEGRDDPRQTVEAYRAFSYFRVTEYRELLLKKVVRKQDEGIEWKANIVDGDVESVPDMHNSISAVIDWQNFFYKPLENNSKSIALNKQLVQNLQGCLWLEQISKRGNTFFYFLYFLMNRLTELSKKIKFIKWQYFAGYNKLVRSFLSEMKNKKLQNYPQSLKQTSVILLGNQKLLNILVSIVLEKTNLNDCNVLMKGLDLISRYLNHFSKNKKLLPTTFNYIYFFKALRIVLEGQFSYAIVKVLAIIYTNYDNFNIEFRRNLALYLLGKVFFRLFLNWSHPTRNAFYHILILKIQRSSDIFDAECRRQFANKHDLVRNKLLQINEIRTRYDECIRLVKNSKSLSKNQNDAIWKRHDRQLYKVLKKKLVSKKRKVQGRPISRRPTPAFENLKSLQIEHYTSFPLPTNQRKYSANDLNLSSYETQQHPETERANTVLITQQLLNSAFSRTPKKQPPKNLGPRARSGTMYLDAETQDDWKDYNIKVTPHKIQRKRSICEVEDFDIKQMEDKEADYLAIGVKQFDNLDLAIRKYYMQNGELPVCELEVEVPIDEKQIKPSTADFEEWETSQRQDDQ